MSAHAGREVVTTPELREGDIVCAYGMRIKLGERHIDPRADRDVVWFLGTILNVEEVDANGWVPRGWRTNDRYPEFEPGTFWQVQGNELATWAREVTA